jgi:hypothetical protein
MLKVDISAGAKNKTLDFEPAFRDPCHYEAPFYPTVETTFNYTVFGNINGTDFRLLGLVVLEEERQRLFQTIPQLRYRQMSQESQ